MFTVLIFVTVWNHFGEGRREWAAALAFQTLGWTLFALGPQQLPEQVFHSARVLNQAGMAFYALAMARMTGRQLHMAAYIAPPLVAAILQSPIGWSWALRPQAMDLNVIVLSLLCIFPLLYRDKQLSRGSRWIVIASFTFGFLGSLGRLTMGSDARLGLSGLSAEIRIDTTRLMLFHLNVIFANVGIALLYRERVAAKLNRLSPFDPLTALFDRANFLEQTTHEVQRAAHTGAPCAALIINLAAFKQINLRYGELAGDRVLQHFSQMLVRTLRAEDLCARWSGASFAVLLSDSGHEGALQFASRLKDAVAATCVEPDGIRYRIDIGIANLMPEDADTGELFDRAEAVLRKTKPSDPLAGHIEGGAPQ